MYEPAQPNINAGDLGALARSLVGWVLAELRKIADEFNAGRSVVKFKRLYENPKRLEADMVAVLDATHPDASLGEGLYIRNAANTDWDKV